jgi:hypothetical protein
VRFSHTLRFTQYDDPECTVIYDLAEVEGGVEFTLTVEKLPVGTKSGKQLVQGGPFIVKTLKTIVEKGRPSFLVRLLYALFALLEPLTPNRCRSERWAVSQQG